MARILRSAALIAMGASALCLAAAPARVLFPNSLHLTRQIEDPVSRTTISIDEYYAGNRVVSVSGDRTVVVDYDKQEITEIDRRAGTWSVSRFDEVASAAAEGGATSAPRRVQANADGAPKRSWTLTPLGVRGSAAGRSVEQFELVDERGQKVEVGIDRSVGLSREAVEVLIGSAYPNPVREEHEQVLRAAQSRPAQGGVAGDHASADDARAYGLPVTQSFTVSDSGAEITFRTAVARIGAELIPPEALLIPPGAKRVESRASALRRSLRELDQIAPSPNPREN